MIMRRYQAILAAVTLLGGTMVHAATSDTQLEDWQQKRLFDPTERQLRMEQKGKVFVYVGLTDRDIVRAMNERFDRVESMMFANTIVTDDSGKPKRDKKTGSIVVEDDGC